jgi:starch-binding outer membrane protein, SusD/RagB family
MEVILFPKLFCLVSTLNFNRLKSFTLKKSISIILIGCVALLSCKKSFLTLQPQSQATSVAFYKTTADISNAVTAAYAPLQSMYLGNFVTMMEARGDNVEDLNPGANAGTEFNIDRFLAKSDNVDITNAWGGASVNGPFGIYNGISRCNNTLIHLDVVTNPALKSQFEGELKFLRALHYFNIVRLWGAAPLVLNPISADDAKKLSRNSVQELYTAIESDLTQAIALLPATYPNVADLGRATQGAAKALLGKVYLTETKYPQAVSTLQDLVQAGNAYNYSLLPNVAAVFDVNNKMNAEIIFAVRFNKTIANQGHGLSTYFNQPGLDPKLISAYEPADARRDLLNTVTLDANDKPVKKYYDTFDPNTKTLGNDFIVLRYADVLLMYAEALNEVGYSTDAFTWLNAVRSRAGASTWSPAGLPDQVSFRNAVLQERRLELPLELHRWFDLIRTNTAIAALQNSGLTPITIQAYQYLYPIPQSELDISTNKTGFTQNTGY